MTTHDAARRWAQTWERAWPRHDVDAIAALYSPQASYRALPFREPHPGGPRGYLTAAFAEETDVRCRFGEPVVEGSRAAVEWWGSWVEGGEEVTLAGVTMLTFNEDGLVADHRDSWNQAQGREGPYAGW